MEIPSKTDVKRIVEEMTKERFRRVESELFVLRRTIRRLEEEIGCINNFKFKGGKNK